MGAMVDFVETLGEADRTQIGAVRTTQVGAYVSGVLFAVESAGVLYDVGEGVLEHISLFKIYNTCSTVKWKSGVGLNVYEVCSVSYKNG